MQETVCWVTDNKKVNISYSTWDQRWCGTVKQTHTWQYPFTTPQGHFLQHNTVWPWMLYLHNAHHSSVWMWHTESCNPTYSRSTHAAKTRYWPCQELLNTFPKSVVDETSKAICFLCCLTGGLMELWDWWVI